MAEAGIEAAEMRSARRMSHAEQLARTARRSPDVVAFRFQGVDRSFAELDDRVSRLAGALSARGVRPGDRVATLMTNRLLFSALLFIGVQSDYGAAATLARFSTSVGSVANQFSAGTVHIADSLAAGTTLSMDASGWSTASISPSKWSRPAAPTFPERRAATRASVS